MRNEWNRPLSRTACNLHPHKHLQCLAAKAQSDPLRKIRDLIIFAKIMRKCAIQPPTAPCYLQLLRCLCELLFKNLPPQSPARISAHFAYLTPQRQ